MGLTEAASTEVRPNTPVPIINLMEDQKTTTIKGGTMRLGAYDCALQEGSLAFRIYGKTLISERHRHRYEYNNIARLITYCANRREQSADWDKVVLIPVTTITDSNSYIVNFRHDFSLNSVRLVGGADPIKVRVTASHFN